jgi:hypothetical protein
MREPMKQKSPDPHEHHAVQFYENENSLFKTVAGFLGQGLVDGHHAAQHARRRGLRGQRRAPHRGSPEEPCQADDGPCVRGNKLALKHGFALLCGYAMANFYKQTAKFEDVCRQHAHIVPAQHGTTPLAPTFDMQQG